MSYIADISHHNTITSWDKVAANSPFIIMKGTEGTNYTDSKVKSYISECEKRSLPYWIYTFLRKGDELKQTKYLVEQMGGLIGSHFVGYVLDVERGNSASNVLEALKYLQKLAYKNMVYCNSSDYSTYGYSKVINSLGDNGAFWNAKYWKNNGQPHTKYLSNADLHQYTSVGRASGMSGDVDLNQIVGDKDLAWFTTPLSSDQSQKSTEQSAKKNFSGTFPVLPDKAKYGRAYYKQGDGITTLKDFPTQIKRVQTLVNWIDDTTDDLVIDGQYGAVTAAKVKKAQGTLGVTADGAFGKATLTAAKAFTK
jgi:GH25 family lysozyme M1 (1,4-beta-N-acetylmuramidase)